MQRHDTKYEVFGWPILVMMVGCGENLMGVSVANYVETHQSARTGLPIAVQFEEIFPNDADHFITHFGMQRASGTEEMVWNSQAYFGGRYMIQMQIPVIVDYDNRTVTRAGDPEFGLGEFTRVEDKGGGQLMGHSDTLAMFGEEEWKKVYESGGDFSVIGVTIKKNAPVPGMDKAVAMARRRIFPIKLLDKGAGRSAEADGNHTPE